MMKQRRRLARLLGGLFLLVAPLIALLAPALALAQQAAAGYEPMNEATRVRTDPNPFILGAYGFIWAAVVVYVVMLARGMRQAQGELDRLRRKVGGG
jgi:CcmD family protein